MTREQRDILTMVARAGLIEADGWIQLLRQSKSDFFQSNDEEKNEVVGFVSDFIVQLCNESMAIGNRLEHFVLTQNAVAHLWNYSQNLIIQKGSVNFGYFEPTFDMLIKLKHVKLNEILLQMTMILSQVTTTENDTTSPATSRAPSKMSKKGSSKGKMSPHEEQKLSELGQKLAIVEKTINCIDKSVTSEWMVVLYRRWLDLTIKRANFAKSNVAVGGLKINDQSVLDSETKLDVVVQCWLKLDLHNCSIPIKDIPSLTELCEVLKDLNFDSDERVVQIVSLWRYMAVTAITLTTEEQLLAKVACEQVAKLTLSLDISTLSTDEINKIRMCHSHAKLVSGIFSTDKMDSDKVSSLFLEAATDQCVDIVDPATQRWLNVNLAAMRNPEARGDLVEAAKKLLKRRPSHRLYWIIVQDLLDQREYREASKMLDKALAVKCRGGNDNEKRLLQRQKVVCDGHLDINPTFDIPKMGDAKTQLMCWQMYSQIQIDRQQLPAAIDALERGISMCSNGDQSFVNEAKLHLSRLYERNNQITKSTAILNDFIRTCEGEFFIRASARLLHSQAVNKHASKIDLPSLSLKVMTTCAKFESVDNVTNRNWLLLSLLDWLTYFNDRNNYEAATNCLELMKKGAPDKKWQLLCYLAENQLIVSNYQQSNASLDFAKIKNLLDGPSYRVFLVFIELVSQFYSQFSLLLEAVNS